MPRDKSIKDDSSSDHDHSHHHGNDTNIASAKDDKNKDNSVDLYQHFEYMVKDKY